jgi:hypothetical protein
MELIFPLNCHSDFHLVSHIRNCFFFDQFQTFHHIEEHFPFWYDERNSENITYWTENHLAAILSSASLIKDESNFDYKIHLHRLDSFLNSRIDYGFSEMFSGVYLPITIASLLNLYDFSIHPFIKKKSKILLDELTFQLINAISFDGSFGIVSTRMYSEYRKHTFDFTIHKWLYFILNKNHEYNNNHYNTSNDIPFNYLDIFVMSTSYRYEKPILFQNGSIHFKNHEIPVNESIWIHWSYGKYFSSDIIQKNIDFMNQYKIYKHYDFKFMKYILLFLSYIKQISNSFYSFILYLMKISKIGYISDISSFDISIYRHFCNSHFLILSYLSQKNHIGIPTAQQWPFLINIDNQLLYVEYGDTVNGPQREMSQMAIFPSINVNHFNNIINISLSFATNELLYMYNNFKYKIEISNDTFIHNECFEITYTQIDDSNIDFQIILKE